MSDEGRSIVERLAKRWATETGTREDRSDARWWLQAIADEMEAEGYTGDLWDVAEVLRRVETTNE